LLYEFSLFAANTVQASRVTRQKELVHSCVHFVGGQYAFDSCTLLCELSQFNVSLNVMYLEQLEDRGVRYLLAEGSIRAPVERIVVELEGSQE
jgi:hypothetical protein